MARREFTRAVMTAAFLRSGGYCEGQRNGERCGVRLYTGKYRYDHILPDWLGGEPTLENCQVICMACDGVKTPQDQSRIAKTKRIRDKHIGAKPPSRYRWPSRPFASQRRSP